MNNLKIPGPRVYILLGTLYSIYSIYLYTNSTYTLALVNAFIGGVLCTQGVYMYLLKDYINLLDEKDRLLERAITLLNRTRIR